MTATPRPEEHATHPRSGERLSDGREQPGGRPLPDDEILAHSEDTFAMLASSARLRLLWLLSDRELNVTTLAEATGASTQAVSQHLTKLRFAGLVSSRREGRNQLYRVDDPHVSSLVAQVVDHHEDLRDRGRRA